MSLINKEVSEFKVQAYAGNDFKEVTKQDILGKWSVFFFLPGRFYLCVPDRVRGSGE